MFTLCPRCKSIHPLPARLLAQAGGQVRCGQCGKAFDALQHLYDERPGGSPRMESAQADAGTPPVLGAAETSVMAATTLVLQPLKRPARWPWRVLVVLLLLATTANIAWTFRDSLAQRPELRQWLDDRGVPGFEARGPFRDPERIHLVSRDFHAHPTRPGVLVLSATFVNLADRPQPLPALAVALMDADNRTLATREFAPADYVLPGTDPGSLLQPNVHTPILLEFVDPGEHAVGFELSFR